MDGWALISFTFKQLSTALICPIDCGVSLMNRAFTLSWGTYFYLWPEQQLRVIDKTSDKPK